MWGGKHRRVPEDFDIPSVTVRRAFQLWHLGDPKGKYPPLRQVEAVDVGDDSGGKVQVNKCRRLANFQSLMRKFAQVRATQIQTYTEMQTHACPHSGASTHTHKRSKDERRTPNDTHC